MLLPLELQYNFRLLRNNVGFVSICILIIALGIGLSITLYTIGDNLGTKTPPLPRGDRYVTIGLVEESNGEQQWRSLDGFILRSLQSSNQSYQVLGARQNVSAVISDNAQSARYTAIKLSVPLLQATEVAPILGRNLLPSDDLPSSEPVVLISYQVWRNFFAARDDIVGSLARINGQTYTVVGVMPEGFNYPQAHEMWLPLRLPASPQAEQWPGLLGIGILSEKTTIQSATTELNNLLLKIKDTAPDTYQNLNARIKKCCSLVNFDGPSPDLYLFPALIMSLILLASLNVANLILVRTNHRLQEFGIRSALGATRKRLISVVLQDSLVICLVGSVLGLGLAALGMRYVNNAATDVMNMIGGMPFWFHFGWEAGTVLRSLLLVTLIWAVSVVLAIWQIYRQDLSVTLAAGKQSDSKAGGAFGISTIVNIEMIFSCFLLILSGVLVGATIELADVDYGTATDGYLIGKIQLDEPNYTNLQTREVYRRNLLQALIQKDGIEAVSFTTDPPSQAGRYLTYTPEDRDAQMNGNYPRKRAIHVADNYFDVMEVPLVAGRHFDSGDNDNSLPVVIIDEVMARQLWPDFANTANAALGKRIQIHPDQDHAKWLTVVGVTSHITQNFALEGGDLSSIYLPFSQPCCTDYWDPIYPVIKVSGNPRDYRDDLQAAALSVDRDLPVTDIVELSDFLNTLNSVMIFAAEMASSIALVTLVLAITGIYAIISRSVLLRRKEIGVRRAVGSSAQKIVLVFMQQGIKYLILGLVLGGGMAIVIANLISADSNRLLDWLTIVVTIVTIGLTLLVLLATYAPARRMILVEPGESLRDE